MIAYASIKAIENWEQIVLDWGEKYLDIINIMSEKREVYFTVTPAEDSNVEYAQQSNQEMNDSEVDLERYFQNISQCRQFYEYYNVIIIYIGIYLYTYSF